MKIRLLYSALMYLGLSLWVRAQDSAVADPTEQSNTNAAAAVATGHSTPAASDFLEHLVDTILGLFDVRSSGNTVTHYTIAVLITLIAYVLRTFVTTMIFGFFKKLAARTETTLDDKLFPALEGPVKAFIVVVGAVAAVKVLKLSPTADQTLGYASTAVFSLVIFWSFLRAFNTVLDHFQEIAREKQLGITPFMPWIKKSLLTVVFVFGALLIAQSLGADVKAFLAGLGIGGLAFALAAQDTIANLFGSVVVAIDQPFRIGETIRIAGNVGQVEDIGLRSTKIRLLDKSLIVIPNKSVASEAVTNLSRFTGRRVEQLLGLTYDTTPDQMESLVTELRTLINVEPEVNAADTLVYFRDFNASSLDIWIVYVVKDADAKQHFALRQKLNLAFMRAVEARGLAFAFPSQTVYAGNVSARGKA